MLLQKVLVFGFGFVSVTKISQLQLLMQSSVLPPVLDVRHQIHDSVTCSQCVLLLATLYPVSTMPHWHLWQLPVVRGEVWVWERIIRLSVGMGAVASPGMWVRDGLLLKVALKSVHFVWNLAVLSQIGGLSLQSYPPIFSVSFLRNPKSGHEDK